MIAISELPNLPETTISGVEYKPPPVDKDSVRSTSSSRPPPPLKDKVSRPSLLHVVSTNPELLSPTHEAVQERRRKYHPFFSQLAQLKHWFKESTKKAKSPMNSKRPVVQKPVTSMTNHNRRISRISANSTYRYSNSH